VQGDQAKATFADGVLTLSIPKSEEVKPRQIKIAANGSAANVDETTAS
jgi:HSP20 family molecular chaperone IbpA